MPDWLVGNAVVAGVVNFSFLIVLISSVRAQRSLRFGVPAKNISEWIDAMIGTA